MEQEREYQRLIENSVCQIVKGDDSKVTAFVINANYLLSVGHAFINYKTGTSFRAIFLDKSYCDVALIESAYDQELLLDYAILEFKSAPANASYMPISFTKGYSGSFISGGFGKTLNKLSNVRGKILGNLYHSDKLFLLKATSGQAGEMGFSGSPILSLEEKSVVAIQCEATNNDIGAERDTILAFPLCRLPQRLIDRYCQPRSIIAAKTFIEKYLLPSFGKSLLCLEHSDNLDAYMRCIVVKLLYQSDERFTVFVARNSSDTIVPSLRKHHKTRKMRYGIVGGMLKANVPIVYDFVNDKCYQLDLGGTSKESNVLTKKTKGAKEDRIALLVAPIRDSDGKIVGVLSFDFFPTQNPKKNIVEIIKDPVERGRLLYMSELYAQTLSQILLKKYEVDIDFINVIPDDL